MKIMVTGTSGLLGSDVWKVFSAEHELIALGRSRPGFVPLGQWRDCDLRKAATIYALVTRENPDLIIHCAAYNDVDAAEKNANEAFQVNAMGTRNLALACQRFDTVLMAISTDYVFDGTNAPEDGYREFDVTHPLSVYAESKRWGEIQVEHLLNKFYIVRTSWLFGEGRATYADKVLSWARDKQPVPCLKDMRSAPTYSADLAKALLQLALSNCFGVYHLTNAGFCSRVEFAQEILRIHKLPETLLKPLTQAEFKQPARRPPFSGLQNLAWKLNGFTALRPWKEALREHFSASQITPR
jgi:dTDP-4-dehydrorhamnose reductase